MLHINVRKLSLGISAGVAAASLALVPAVAATGHTGDQAKLQLVITRGTNEISRRLSTLNTLSNKISGAPKLSSDDKANLTQEVTDEISNLTSLKTKLAADTDVATARSDAQSIITDYRVYALVVPKINLVRVADDQLAAEDKLTTLAGKLQTRLSTAKNSSALQSGLSDMTAKITAAQAISSNVEASVIGLQPSDYNSDHSLLSGYRNQLKTAQNDLQAAVTDAKTLLAGLKAGK